MSVENLKRVRTMLVELTGLIDLMLQPSKFKGERLHVRCERCKHKFLADPELLALGSEDWQITCPNCQRHYLFNSDDGEWRSDRPLTVFAPELIPQHKKR